MRAVLSFAVPELLPHFHIVAFNPSSRGIRDPEDAYKRRHIREIAQHYGVTLTLALALALALALTNTLHP